jgi:hypothetical protein
MNIFVLCTGRCGSVTFIEACRWFANYTAGHETRTGALGPARFAYAPRHIEADNRLAWLLGRLDLHYGPEAFYVHLRREQEATAASFARRADSGIMKAYQRPGILMGLPGDADPLAVARDYVSTVTANIEMFLRDKPWQMRFDLEDAGVLFPEFCDRIGAEVDMPRALEEFRRRHNASLDARGT